jgi:hypothetical protein
VGQNGVGYASTRDVAQILEHALEQRLLPDLWGLLSGMSPGVAQWRLVGQHHGEMVGLALMRRVVVGDAFPFWLMEGGPERKRTASQREPKVAGGAKNADVVGR